MKFHHYQKGVGLIEVLVALLLLAVGVLGYSILQIRAVDASS
ncbi:MAG: prepilin-type N-terminal cleavage/methylation domain-containing protein, partial [Acinetobacter sp.]